jgi:ABC-type Mn2+/Zn2+ transport system permease subunit
MLALGVIMVSRSDSFNGDIVRILFGEILGIRPGTIVILAIATLVISLSAAILYRPFLLLSFDAAQADASGFSSRRYHLVMLTMVAATVVVSFQAVGTLLVFGMLVAPASTGALLARRVSAMIGWAIGVGAISVYVGLLLSYHYDLAAGATVVFVTVGAFFIIFAIQLIRQRRAKSMTTVIGAT